MGDVWQRGVEVGKRRGRRGAFDEGHIAKGRMSVIAHALGHWHLQNTSKQPQSIEQHHKPPRTSEKTAYSLLPKAKHTLFTDMSYVYPQLLQLNLHRELTGLSLVVPFLHPVKRAERRECLPENLAWLIVLTLDGDTVVVVNIVLGAALALVGVRESGVELRGVEFEGFAVKGLRHNDVEKCVVRLAGLSAGQVVRVLTEMG